MNKPRVWKIFAMMVIGAGCLQPMRGDPISIEDLLLSETSAGKSMQDELKKAKVFLLMTKYKEERFANWNIQGIYNAFQACKDHGIDLQVRILIDGKSDPYVNDQKEDKDYAAIREAINACNDPAFTIRQVVQLGDNDAINNVSNEGCVHVLQTPIVKQTEPGTVYKNLKLGQARLELLQYIKKFDKAHTRSDQNVYFMFFDGDDACGPLYIISMVACLLKTGGDCVTADDLKVHELLIKYIALPKTPDLRMKAEWKPLPLNKTDKELGEIKCEVYRNFPKDESGGGVNTCVPLNKAGQEFFANQQKECIHCYYNEQQKQIEVTGDVKEDSEMIGDWYSGNKERISLHRDCKSNYSECVCLFTANILDGQRFDDFVKGMKNHQKILLDLYDFVETCTKDRYFLQLQSPQYMYTTRLGSMEHSYLEAFLDFVADLNMPTDSDFDWDKHFQGIMPFFQCMVNAFNWPEECAQMSRSVMCNLGVTKPMYDDKLSNLPQKVQQIHKIFFEPCSCLSKDPCKNCQFKECVQSAWKKIADTMPEAMGQSQVQALFDDQKFCQLPFWKYLLEKNGEKLSPQELRRVLGEYSNWNAFIWGEKAGKTQTVHLNENRQDP